MASSFADVVASNYEEIKRNFKSGAIDKGYEWNEDLLHDAFISCVSSLKDKQVSKTEAIKYFWTAYVNKYKTKKSKVRYKVSIEDHDVDVVCEVYDEDKDHIYNIIIDAVQNEYGLRKAHIWEMYVCEGKSAKEILQMGFNDVDNFVYFARKVKRFIKRFIESEPKLKEFVKNRFEVI